ncbi:MAG: chemotaxis protein CheB [bacterium]
MKRYEAVVMGVSTGGLKALETVLRQLTGEFSLPVMIVQHRIAHSDDFLCRFLAGVCPLKVMEAEEKSRVKNGHVYIAPPDYHLQVEMDRTLSLSVDPPVNYSRPSVDVLFQTAAEVFQDRLVGVILTGANRDGSLGLAEIKRFGGLAVVQDPDTALAPEMPRSAIKTACVDHVLALEDIGRFLAQLDGSDTTIR